MAERLSARLPKSAQREQEDAHEFFNFLVDGAHEELLRLRTAYAETLGEQGECLSQPACYHTEFTCNPLTMQMVLAVLIRSDDI